MLDVHTSPPKKSKCKCTRQFINNCLNGNIKKSMNNTKNQIFKLKLETSSPHPEKSRKNINVRFKMRSNFPY